MTILPKTFLQTLQKYNSYPKNTNTQYTIMLQSFLFFQHPQISPANQKKTHHYSSFRLRGSSFCFLPRSQIIIELHKGRVRAFGVGLHIVYQDDSLKVKIPLRVQIRPQHHRKIEEGEVAQYLLSTVEKWILLLVFRLLSNTNASPDTLLLE